MNLSVAFHTLGCKQNQFDTQSLRSRILKGGFSEASQPERADWFVLNTCAVTERAMAKARGEIGRLRRRNPDVKIIAVGCGALHQPDNFTGADFVGAFPSKFGLRSPDAVASKLLAPHGVIPTNRSRALLRIQNGCDQFCAFCIVPHLRGPSRSVPINECRRALRDLLDENAPEIVLTGTNIALWGRDLPGAPSLLGLLRALLAEIGPARLRLSSLEPHLISPEFINWCLDQPQICRHFHLAVQSGSPRLLNLMERGAPPSDFYEYLADLALRYPDVSLGADVMAGLPGETQADFEETLKLVESIPLSYLHVFPYSERPGTRAVDLPGSVPVSERLKRAKILRRADAELRRRFAQVNAGKIHDIVTVGNSDTGGLRGLTSNYLRVSFPADFMPPGSRFSSPVVASGSVQHMQ